MMSISSNIFEEAFDQAVYAINITDLKGRVLKVNQAYLNLYEMKSTKEIEGQNQSFIRSIKTPLSTYKEMWEAISTDKPWTGELVNTTVGGKEVFVFLTITPLWENKRKIGYLGFTLDRGQQASLEQQLLHANKLVILGTLGAGIAHEINNPLTSISLEADYLKEIVSETQFDEQEQVMNAVNSIIKNTDRMKKVIEHLLIYSRKGDDSFYDSFKVNDLLQDSLLFIGKQLVNRDIILRITEEQESFVKGNATNLESVFHNLLTNSRDAFNDVQKKEKWIEIRMTHEDKSHLLIEYSDNAGGIPQSQINQIFDPFYTTKGEGEGTGLGLAITKKIIVEHGGVIRCRSLNDETHFTILLPLDIAV